VAALMQQMAELKKQAAQYIRQNELGQVIEQSGGVGLNAATSADSTTYFYSLPSNKLELWMSLESERFLQPVFREFYEEREVILEERRMRLENDPTSQLIAAVADKAYDRHPYGVPIIGERSDIENLTRQNVQDFFDRHYGPENLTVAIVGDVDPLRAKALAEQYFGRLAKRPVPAVMLPKEPPQKAEREVQVQLQSQPWYVEAYHSPAGDDPDGLTASILESVLSSGRTSRLYRSLVEEQRVALAAQGMTGYPGDKYPNLMLFYAITAPGKTLNDVQAALRKELERVVNEPVTVAELDRIKTQTRASVLKSLTSNTGMAQTLAEYKVKRGSWQMLFADLEAIDRLTPADLQRVARKILRPENRTVGRLIPKGE
jgi:predicted Zn-dependent peptidase